MACIGMEEIVSILICREIHRFITSSFEANIITRAIIIKISPFVRAGTRDYLS